MNILVTGSSGFIGSHVAAALVSDGHDVSLLDRVLPYRSDGLRPDITKDLRDLSSSDLPDGLEAVVHLAALGGVARAAKDPEDVFDANVRGTMRLIQAARSQSSLGAFVHASSFSVYGDSYAYRCAAAGHILRQESCVRRKEDLDAGRFDIYCHGLPAWVEPADELTYPAPSEAYGVSKLMQEFCYQGSCCHVPVSVLRFSSVYGPKMRPLGDGDATVIATVADSLKNGRAPRLFEDGLQSRDWVYVTDVIDSIRACLKQPFERRLVNVCSGTRVTLKSACKLIARAMGRYGDSPWEVVGGYRAGDMRHCLGDPTRMIKLLGRVPTSFEEGVEQAFGCVS